MRSSSPTALARRWHTGSRSTPLVVAWGPSARVSFSSMTTGGVSGGWTKSTPDQRAQKESPHRRDPVGAIGPHLRERSSDEHQYDASTTAGAGRRPHDARPVDAAPRRDPG